MFYLSILSIFKNESFNMKVWLDHYIWQGVEHFYLIDNGSTDNCLEILQPYIDKGLVSYFYMPQKHMQLELIVNVYDELNLSENTEWLCICDLDEFFYGTALSLKEQLQEFPEKIIYSNWLMFGTSNLINHPEDIRLSNIHREPTHSHLTKYIFRPKNVKSEMIWIHDIDGLEESARCENDLIHLNHYSLQSLEYFQKVKMTRGDVAWEGCDNLRNMDYFNDYNKKAIEIDTTLRDLLQK